MAETQSSSWLRRKSDLSLEKFVAETQSGLSWKSLQQRKFTTEKSSSLGKFVAETQSGSSLEKVCVWKKFKFVAGESLHSNNFSLSWHRHLSS